MGTSQWSDGAGAAEGLQCRRTNAGGTVHGGSSVGAAVVEVGDQSSDATRAGALESARAAWRWVGPSGRALVLAAWGACLVAAIAWLPATWRVAGTGAALVVLVVAALVDAVEHRLPNALVALAALPVGITVALAWSGDVGRGALVGLVAVGGPLLVTHLVAPAGMGFGDVKAGLVLGAALGLVDSRLALLALVLGLAAGATYGLARRARSIPLGPFLVAGAIASLAVGRVFEMTVITG